MHYQIMFIDNCIISQANYIVRPFDQIVVNMILKKWSQDRFVKEQSNEMSVK